jgi:hypothetical protein
MQWIRIIISSGRLMGDHRMATFRPSKQWTSNENRGWRLRYLLPFMLLHPLFETPNVCPECFTQPPSERASRDEPTRTLLKKTVEELRSSGGKPWGGAIPGITATEVPDSACLKANAICSSEKFFFPIQKTHPFWCCQGQKT